MQNNLWKKCLILGIIILFFGASVTPNIIGDEPVNGSYDREAAYNYAHKYWNEVCSDGYFWDSPSTFISLDPGTDITSMSGYDCAHFVSCCIGYESNEQGGGLEIPSRVLPTYGEPGAVNLRNWLVDSGNAVEVISIDNLQMGDVIIYTWSSGGHHAALYLGGEKVASHTACVWNADWQLDPDHTENYRFIHIIIPSSPTDWWPMFRHDLSHSGYSTSDAPDTNNVKWDYTTGDDVISSPSVSDGKIYVGSWDNKVYCLDADDGTKIWDYTTDFLITLTSPAIADGKVYIGSDDNKVYCLDADDGTKIWDYTTGDFVLSSPAIADGKVYIGSNDNMVYCLDADDGTKIWAYYTTSVGAVSSSPAVANGKVYIGSGDKKVYCLNAGTGAWIWDYTTGRYLISSPAIADGKVYIGSCDNKVYCLDADDGTKIWDYTTGDDVISSPAIADGKVYIGSNDNKVYCLDANDGTKIWDYTTDALVVSSPAVSDGKVYIGSHDNKVYCLDANDGTKIWDYTTGDHVSSSPAVANGKVYIGSSDGKVYCFGDAGDQPPTCAIELQKNGVPIDNIDVGEFFDIYVGDSTDDQGILEVRFSSDDSQDGIPTGSWTQWYNWDILEDDWHADTKIMEWSFATGGTKEVWAEIKDTVGQTSNCSANIYAAGIYEWKSGDIGYVAFDCIAVDDIDNDGTDEIIVGTWNGFSSSTYTYYGCIYIFNAVTKELEWKSADLGRVIKILVSDLTGDGTKELLVKVFRQTSGPIGNQYGYLYVFDGVTHSKLWQSDDYLGSQGDLVVADLDDDGIKEIITGGMHYYSSVRHGRVYVFNGDDYSLRWQSGDISTFYPILIDDVDDDAVKEIIFGTRVTDFSGNIYVFDGISFDQEWKSSDIGGVYVKTLVINDVDVDGIKEIIAGVQVYSNQGNIYVFDGKTKVQEWKSPGEDMCTNLMVNDIDDDGTKEIIARTWLDICVFDGKTYNQEWESENVGASLNLEVIDIDSDGTKEILTRDVPQSYHGYLCILDGITHELEWQSVDIGVGEFVVVDIDDDGEEEIVAGGSFEKYHGYLYIFEAPESDVDQPWPMFHHDLQHSGYSTSSAPDTNNTIWSYTTGGLLKSSPAVANDKVYIGSRDNKVYCLDADTGGIVWEYTTGDNVDSSPAVKDDKVYIGGIDNKMYCLDANTGSYIWSYTTGNNVVSSPAVYDDKVYIGSMDYKVYCLDANTGSYKWSYTTGNKVASSPAVYNGKVYIGSYDHKVYCLDANTGGLVWSYTTGNWVPSSPAVVNSKVYVGSWDHKVYCLDANTGGYIWSYITGDKVGSTPAIAYGKVYIGSYDHKVYCLDADTGDLIWSYTTGYSIFSSPAVADGKVYIGSDDHKVYCLDADTGGLIWKYTTGYDVRDSPAVANGKVYIGSFDNKVYCFGDVGDQPPTCAIELQKDGIPIDNIDVEEFFDIYIGGSTDDQGIAEVRFSSDESQDGVPTGSWTQWYNWDISEDDWHADTKIMEWSFATGGPKEVWAEVNDGINPPSQCSANIYANFYFVHITDTHIRHNNYGENYFDYENSVESLRNVLFKIRKFSLPPAFVVNTGDIVDCGGSGDIGANNYMEYISLINGLKPNWYLNWFYNPEYQIPVFNCPGNHDHREYARKIGSMPWSHNLQNYKEYIDTQSWYREWIDETTKTCIISLDSGYDKKLTTGTKWPPVGTGLDPEQLDLLSSTLDSLDDIDNEIDVSNYKKIIFMHHPVIYYRFNNDWKHWAGRLRGGVWNAGCIANEKEKFLNICNQYEVDVVLCGHTHDNRVYSRNMDGKKDYRLGHLSYPVSTPNAPLYVITGSTLDSTYRIIECKSDEVIVYKEYYVMEKLKAQISGCPVELHLFDYNGNHVGRNESSGIDIEIENATYSFLPLEITNETDPDLWNHSIEEISLLYGTGNYTYLIKGTGEGIFNFSIQKQLTDGSKITFFYQNISITENSTGELYVFEDSVDYTIHMDDNCDGFIDRMIQPDEIISHEIPYPPAKPSGPTIGDPNILYSYSTNTTDPEDDQIYYLFDWDDDTDSGWLGPCDSGNICSASHSWSENGIYYIRVKAKDVEGHLSDWSNVLTVVIDDIPPEITAEFIPIDVEEDEGLFEISFSVTDNCDPNPTVTAVILLPELIDPEIEYIVEDEVKIEIDLEENEIEVKGPDPEALWQEIQTLGGLPVETGQQVYIEPEEDPEEIEIKYEDVLLKIEGYLPTLKVTATDFVGNVAEVTVQPIFEEED